MGRPKGSKNKTKAKANTKTQSKIKQTATVVEKQKFSFDLDSIILMADVIYVIRKQIEDKAVELYGEKLCIPKSVIEKVITSMGLKKFIPEKPLDF